MTTTEKPLPLAGLRIIEMGHTVMGPSCAVVLADLGADVIKVEPPEGERTRHNIGFGSGLFPLYNRNKRSICIDLKSDTGRGILTKLITTADVLVENFAHGTLDRLGFGWAQLENINPRLIYCALKGFLSGPYEHRPALDEVVQYMAGLAYMTGPRGQPLRAGASVVDLMGGMFGVIGIMAALKERERTGRGQMVKSALFESTAFMVAQHMTGQIVSGEEPPPMPHKSSSWAIYETFTTAEGKVIFIAITSDNHWRAFCKAFGLDALLNDPALKTNPQRAAARGRITPTVTRIVAERRYEELANTLERLKIPYAPLAKPADLFDDPHLNAGGHMLDLHFFNGQRANIPGLPLELSHHKLGIRSQPPRKGENTRAVLDELGYASSDIDGWIAQGIALLPEKT
ncbi:MAG: CoA transferase [Betaproteobacteria bacterium]|nr:CoA transferase [Betaproteobacteria bacterium]